MSLTNTTNRSRVYVTRQLPQKGLDLLLGRCNVSYWDSADPAPRTELLRNIPGIDVLVCMPTDKIDREILNAAGMSFSVVVVFLQVQKSLFTCLFKPYTYSSKYYICCIILFVFWEWKLKMILQRYKSLYFYQHFFTL